MPTEQIFIIQEITRDDGIVERNEVDISIPTVAGLEAALAALPSGTYPRWNILAGEVYQLLTNQHQIVMRVMRSSGIVRVTSGARLVTRGH